MAFVWSCPLAAMLAAYAIVHQQYSLLFVALLAIVSSLLIARISASRSDRKLQAACLEYHNTFRHADVLPLTVSDCLPQDAVDFLQLGLSNVPSSTSRLPVIFVVRILSGPRPAQLKAFPFFQERARVYVTTDPRRMTDTQRFLFFHEIGHCHPVSSTIQARESSSELFGLSMLLPLVAASPGWTTAVTVALAAVVRRQYEHYDLERQLEIAADSFAIRFLRGKIDLKKVVARRKRFSAVKLPPTVQEHLERFSNEPLPVTNSGECERLLAPAKGYQWSYASILLVWVLLTKEINQQACLGIVLLEIGIFLFYIQFLNRRLSSMC
jgi:hypothetical protein